MNTTIFPKVAVGATAALAVSLFYAAHAPVAAKTPKPTIVASASQGKGLTEQFRCTGCHAPTLAGRPGFSPSLHQSAILKSYTQASFVRVLLTGVTPGGGHVHPPMPVYNGLVPARPSGMRPGGPPPGGMRPGGMRPGGRNVPPPMSAGQAADIYAYLHTLK